MLKILTELNGVAGNEEKVADFILSQVSGYADEIIRDSMGNLVFLKRGKKPTAKKLLFLLTWMKLDLFVPI